MNYLKISVMVFTFFVVSFVSFPVMSRSANDDVVQSNIYTYDQQEIRIIYKGTPVHLKDSYPQLYCNRILLSMDSICQLFNLQGYFNKTTETIIFHNQDIKQQHDILMCQVDNTTYYINKTALTLNTTPLYLDNRIFVPVRCLAEYLKLSLNWDQETFTLTIQ